MKNKYWLLLSVGVLVATIYAITLLEDPLDITEKQEADYYPITSVVDVFPQVNKGEISVFAEVKPRWQADVKAHVQGEIIQIAPEALAGQRVSQGALLMQIQASQYRADLDDAEKTLADAKLALLQEQKKAEKALHDWELSGLAQRPTDLALNKPQLEIAQKAVEAAQSRVAAAQQNLAYTQITAPFEGYITQRNASLGQTVTQGDALYSIVDTTQLDIELSLSRQQWDLLAKDWGIDLKARVEDETGQLLGQAEIKRGGGFLDSATRQYKLFLELVQDERQQALSGEFVHVVLPGISVANTLRLPEGAVTREGHLWYVDSDDRLGRFEAEVLFFLNGEVVVRKPVWAEAQHMVRIATNPLASFLVGTKVSPQQSEEE